MREILFVDLHYTFSRECDRPKSSLIVTASNTLVCTSIGQSKIRYGDLAESAVWVTHCSCVWERIVVPLDTGSGVVTVNIDR